MSHKSPHREEPKKSKFKAENQNLKCSFCDKPALFRCDKCQKFLSCSDPSIHTLEWFNHITTCFNAYTKTALQSEENEDEIQATQIDTQNNQDKILTSPENQIQNKEINFSKEVSKFQKTIVNISPRNANKHSNTLSSEVSIFC